MTKHTDTERFGGPGASHENARLGVENTRGSTDPGQRKTADRQRNPNHSSVSGGGGERDSHHTRDPELKG